MKNFKNIGLYVLLLVLIASLAIGCTPENQENEVLPLKDVEDQEVVESEYPIDIVDKFGNEEKIEEEPMKIVSLAPHNTEILFALGMGDKVVGVTSFCDYPEEARTKEVIGGFSEFNLEKIVELDPDIVLIYGAGNEEENKILQEAGIKVFGFMPETIDQVIEDMLTIGRMTGSSHEAREITNAMVEKKDEIIGKIKNEETIKVFYEVWHEPLRSAGEGSFMGELIRLAGGKNIAADEDLGPYPIFDLEQLVERDPEVYLTAADMPEKTIESIKDRPGYEAISAIRNNRIYIYEGNEANIVSRPGPRIVEALGLVAKSIHPEVFK